MLDKIHFSTTLMWGASPEEIGRRAQAFGVAGLELWAQQLFSGQEDWEKWFGLKAAYNLDYTLHGCSWDINLAALNEGIRRASVAEVVASLVLAKEFGILGVTIHPGHLSGGSSREGAVRRIQVSLMEIAEEAEALGVGVSLEIMEKIPREIATDQPAMAEITGELYDFFTYTLDLAHCDSVGEARVLVAQMPRIDKIHISNRLGPRFHTPLDSGDHDFRRLIPELLTWGKPLIVEGFEAGVTGSLVNRNLSFLKQIEKEVKNEKNEKKNYPLVDDIYAAVHPGGLYQCPGTK